MGTVRDEELTGGLPPSQLERCSLPTCYYFQMECRRWASSHSFGGFLLWFSSLSGFDGWLG